ncbi:DUF1934 domain-containing protein [Ferdinandcohnia quinoae]|uniref:DUF1934 domain-containing protein n=1 Tax=Fredinandcohnia quinoae TaxID=2918902 RepID=A0AAW5E3Q8_9BACI|nr:DUF1934 domain-containing protein [Fredinandcohnia sp. SECRCQ15]MCH1626189.1 DUF1934 domain-containing protein [Fredinandcohnia sp. SECRCQ15]
MSAFSQNGTPIQIKFVTEIKDGLRKENVAFDTNGLYYIKGSSTYLSFEELQEVGPVKTIIKITDSDVLILRSGAAKMRQLYRKNEEIIGTFQNQMGTFEMTTKTNNIEYKYYKNSRKGTLFLSYELSLQGEKSGRYAISITFKEREE